MFILDAHCDTITRLMALNGSLQQNNCHIDLQRMKKYTGYVQFFAAFAGPAGSQAYTMKKMVRIIDRFYSELEENKEDITLCGNGPQIEAALRQGKIAAVLSLEGGDALQGELASLRVFYRLGVRCVGLTWNHRNEIADGVADGSSDGGLTPFGREVVGEMNRLGMLIDVSHLAERGFWDVVGLSSAPVVASHSNAVKICNHCRNLTDEQILALKKIGGVMGINFYPYFLSSQETASLADILKHIEYVVALAGTDMIGIGADFDGIECTPADVTGVQDMEKVLNALAKLNYSPEDIEKIAGRNFMRVIQAVCK